MKTLYLTIVCCLFATVGFAQDFPPNAKAGECYMRCSPNNFDYNKKFKGDIWTKIPCDEMAAYKEVQKSRPSSEKFYNYQANLKALGYDLDLTGLIDKKFIKAHNKYLKQQVKLKK